MTLQKRILICDVNIKKQGHYIGYNQYVLDNFKVIEKANSQYHYIFLFNPEAKDLLTIHPEIADRVHYLATINQEETFINRIKQFRTIAKFASEKQVTSMIFMDLDKYQVAIALTKLTCTVSGVLFRPHHRITSSQAASETKTYLRRLKKITAERILLSNKKVDRIFILNDEEGVTLLNKKYNTHIFYYLPDPIFRYINTYSSKTPKQNEPFTYLLFGALNERKNITNIINAYEKTAFTCKTKLVLIGPGEQDYLTYLKGLIENLKTMNDGNKTIEVKNEFVSNEAMENYFASSDVCLLIYKNFYGSSGLIGRAALHHIKVIAPNVGLLDQMVSESKIGITCDPESIESISESLKASIDFPVSENSFKEFYQKSSPEKFLETLLSHKI